MYFSCKEVLQLAMSYLFCKMHISPDLRRHMKQGKANSVFIILTRSESTHVTVRLISTVMTQVRNCLIYYSPTWCCSPLIWLCASLRPLLSLITSDMRNCNEASWCNSWFIGIPSRSPELTVTNVNRTLIITAGMFLSLESYRSIWKFTN